VSTFTTWVMGILQAAQKLHEESLDISQVREFLDYPEPFRFEEGIPLEKHDVSTMIFSALLTIVPICLGILLLMGFLLLLIFRAL